MPEARISTPYRGWMIVIVINAVYFFVYFHRVSSAVLAPPLMEEFSASAASLGVMSATYFYAYGLSQPLIGILTDRWGSRKVITFFTVIGFIGSLIFGLAPSLFLASLGRFLIGLGTAGVFVPALKAILIWFGPRAFSQLSSILVAVGNIGAIAASTPFAWIIQKIGWRASFFGIAGITLILALLSWLVIRDKPQHSLEAEKIRYPSSRQNDNGILKNSYFWMMGSLFFFFGGPFTTFQGLWGFPFLLDVYKCDRLQASNLLMVIALGVIAGGPPLVYLLGKYFPNGKRPQLSLCIGLQVFVWIFLVLTGPSLGNWALVFLFFLMGLSLAGFFALFWSIVQEITPAHRLGTVMGYLNPAAFLGIAIFQPVTGYLMDRVGKIGGTFPFQAYQHAFFLCLVSIALSLALSLSLLRKRSFKK